MTADILLTFRLFRARHTVYAVWCAFLLVMSGCTSKTPPAPSPDAFSDAFQKRKTYKIARPAPKSWRPAAVDAGEHTVVAMIPGNWPPVPHQRYTRKEGKVIEFYPPGGKKGGDTVSVSRVRTPLSPEGYAETDKKLVELFCGATNTGGKVLERGGGGVTALLLCGSMGGSTGVSTALNRKGEVTLYRLEQGPHGVYKIAHTWCGGAFNVQDRSGKSYPAPLNVIEAHRKALRKTLICDKTNPAPACGKFM